MKSMMIESSSDQGKDEKEITTNTNLVKMAIEAISRGSGSGSGSGGSHGRRPVYNNESFEEEDDDGDNDNDDDDDYEFDSDSESESANFLDRRHDNNSFVVRRSRNGSNKYGRLPLYRRKWMARIGLLLLLLVLVLMMGLLVILVINPILVSSSKEKRNEDNNNYNNVNVNIGQSSKVSLPQQIIDLQIYNVEQDFVNERGISPPYWTTTASNFNADNSIGSSKQIKESSSSSSSSSSSTTWGPCFPYSLDKGHSDDDNYNDIWSDERTTTDTTIIHDIHSNSSITSDDEKGHSTTAPTSTTITTSRFDYLHNPNDKRWQGPSKQDGQCRPGFLIIGAGKCGTSSLYHYLLGHPRVAPAYEKQIHYFIYYTKQKSLSWYYSWFPTAKSFLQHGSLITGEASPGYLPYPRAVQKVSTLLPGNPKIILIGRNPLTRMYSSYQYSYITPTLKVYKEGQSKYRDNIQPHQDDDYYQPYLFSFEDFIRAELNQLKKCLNDFGPKATRDQWYKEPWTRDEFDRRDRDGLDPLIDLDSVCYGGRVNRTVLKPQWAEMQMEHPHNFIPTRTVFLIQSFIGRSLYTLPLEWWYILFDPKDIIFYCTEELNDPNEMNELSLRLGLPSYDFTDIIGQGAFNVGTNQGYDTATSWKDLTKEGDGMDGINSINDSLNANFNITSPEPSVSPVYTEDNSDDYDDGIPLSKELRQELLDFIRPYNERLFRLTGKRCDWY